MIAVLDGIAKVLFFGGLVLMLGSVGMLVLNYAKGSGVPEKEIIANVDLLSNPALLGAICVGIGGAYLFWAEEILGPLMLIVAGAMLFSPSYLPLIIQATPPKPELILESISRAGIGLGLLGLFVVVWDIVSRVRIRINEGVKADQIKYGKGMKEEKDIRNVFMGKCWQLPYCRKFVRERCPIYHTRRTCWKERVGCMCEESVIRNAMEGKTIPKDMVAAAKFIPKNSRLTPQQKAERCRQCVIYNEHQKHKYKLAIPVSFASCIGLYVVLGQPVASAMLAAITSANSVLNRATVGVVEKNALANAPTLGPLQIHQVLVVVLFFILAVYSIKMVEYMIFRLKV